MSLAGDMDEKGDEVPSFVSEVNDSAKIHHKRVTLTGSVSLR